MTNKPLTCPHMTASVAKLFFINEDAPHLQEALTHPSFANEGGETPHNQRLEFLGDAVLELCCSEALWRKFPDADEGEMTRRRAQLVNADALADFARTNNIADALLLGKGAEANGLRDSTNVLADAVEALIAAAHIDGGLDAAKQACAQIIGAGLARIEQGKERDAKTALQELVQAAGQPAPTYSLLDAGGPAHERWFEVEVRVAETVWGTGKDRSKRSAEMAAARQAMSQREEITIEVTARDTLIDVTPYPAGAGQPGSIPSPPVLNLTGTSDSNAPDSKDASQ